MFRVGYGYDSHRFAPERKLILCGVLFPQEKGLLGHSDADVAVHAVIDAILGAAAMGDIGSHFPDTDEKYKGANSLELLSSVVDEIALAGWSVGNIDLTIICEEPKIRGRVDEMRRNLSRVLCVGMGDVSVKGKTNEKLDDIGAGLGIQAHAAILLKRK
jgi:2-C-methyl-D-erythritol 2,4-cyclodiphosphate synthase